MKTNMKTTPKKEDNPKTSCVAHYVRAAGPATRVAGSNSLELVSTLLSEILRQRHLSIFQVPKNEDKLKSEDFSED